MSGWVDAKYDDPLRFVPEGLNNVRQARLEPPKLREAPPPEEFAGPYPSF